jgi:NodT family efflux transporter outer membrane factor (OMF) lipoprotein
MYENHNGTSSARRRLARAGHETGPSARHRLVGTLAVAVLAMLSGCASLAPALDPIALPVASNWRTQPDTPGVAAAADLAWREYFTDPALQALIETALENNRDLRVALLRTEEARAAFRIQRAQQAPMVGVGAQHIRTGLPDGLQPLAGRSVLEVNVASVGISSWELDLWGRVRSMKTAALEQWLATEQGHRAVELALVAQVADAYLGLRELDERILLAQQTIASREKSYRIFTRRHEVGAISRLDLKQVETLWLQAVALGAQLEQQRATRINALQVLVGKPFDLPHEDVLLDDSAVMRDLPAGLPSDLLIHRPDIIAAEYQLRAANANIGAARAAFFPRITLTGAVGTASTQLSNLFTGPGLAWNFGPSLSLPIFDMGRRQANLEVAKAQRDQAVTSYEMAIQSAFRDVADAIAARQWLAAQVDVLRETVAAQSERARLAQLRYDHGAAPFLEVLDAQRDLLDAQQQLVQTRRALLSSRVSLYTALGGGAFATSADVPEPASAPAKNNP